MNWFKSTNIINTPSIHRQSESGHLIDLRQVEKTYQSAAGTFTALKKVDLQFNSSEFVAVIGKSGSGKSTLINMITGIDRPTSGEVCVGGTAVHTLSEGQIAIWRGRNVGVVFQFFQLLPTLTVLENVLLPMDFCDMYQSSERIERATHLLDQVDMADQAQKLPSALSGGQQQRVAIARSLANDPPILVADEPTGNLDSVTADNVIRLFEELVAAGKTILMVTHDNDLARRATRTITIVDGQIVDEINEHNEAAVKIRGRERYYREEMMMIRFILVDDHTIVREGLRRLLHNQADWQVVAETSSGQEALQLAGIHQPDVIILETHLQTEDGFEICRAIVERYPQINVIMFTDKAEEAALLKAVEVGAAGFVLKQATNSRLHQVMKMVVAGQTFQVNPRLVQVVMSQVQESTLPAVFADLSSQELNVLTLLTTGSTNREIAKTMHLAEGTIRNYVSNLLEKLEVTSRVEAVSKAIEHNLNFHWQNPLSHYQNRGQ